MLLVFGKERLKLLFCGFFITELNEKFCWKDKEMFFGKREEDHGNTFGGLDRFVRDSFMDFKWELNGYRIFIILIFCEDTFRIYGDKL
jgi:hypothetical protein